jgi:hypothetical protein
MKAEQQKEVDFLMIYKIFLLINQQDKKFLLQKGIESQIKCFKNINFHFSSFQSTASSTNKIPLNELKNSSSSKSIDVDLPFPVISLESIRPSSVNPSINLKLSRDTGLHCVLHIARDSPRPDLIVCVLTVTNTNTSNTINNFHFQVAVSKVNSFHFLFQNQYLFLTEYENQITKCIR